MAQISRPFQIALVALVLFAGVWLLALRGHSGTSGGTASSTPSQSPAANTHTINQAAPTRVYHGSAPGVEGLTKAIAKAHGAVATSQQNAKQLEQKSAAASSASAPGHASSSTAQSSAPASARATAPKTAAAPAAKPAAKSSSPLAPPARQLLVERDLKSGKVAVILFWNRQGAEDRAVQAELRKLGASNPRSVAVFQAQAGEVASFGTITRGVPVSQTPTLLFVNGKGQTVTVTGYTDSYAMSQTLSEARAG